MHEPDLASLTPQEANAIALVAQGYTDTQIAASMGIKPSTVSRFIRHVCKKLRAPNRTAAAVRYACDSGFKPQCRCATRPTLANREHSVLALMAQGCTDEQIATTLIVSRRTVTHYVRAICEKLEAPNRTAAVVQYYCHPPTECGKQPGTHD